MGVRFATRDSVATAGGTTCTTSDATGVDGALSIGDVAVVHVRRAVTAGAAIIATRLAQAIA